MVTLANTQNYNEFELHARTILGIPIPEIILLKNGASAVILAKDESHSEPVFVGVQKVLSEVNTDVRLFGKQTTQEWWSKHPSCPQNRKGMSRFRPRRTYGPRRGQRWQYHRDPTFEHRK